MFQLSNKREGHSIWQLREAEHSHQENEADQIHVKRSEGGEYSSSSNAKDIYGCLHLQGRQKVKQGGFILSALISYLIYHQC